MENSNTPRDPKDAQLWELAKRRTSFKYNLAMYVVFMAFFWGLWYFTAGRHGSGGWPWPIWPMLGWGVGIVVHYVSAYVSTGMSDTEKEYHKLKDKQNLNQ